MGWLRLRRIGGAACAAGADAGDDEEGLLAGAAIGVKGGAVPEVAAFAFSGPEAIDGDDAKAGELAGPAVADAAGWGGKGGGALDNAPVCGVVRVSPDDAIPCSCHQKYPPIPRAVHSPRARKNHRPLLDCGASLAAKRLRAASLSGVVLSFGVGLGGLAGGTGSSSVKSESMASRLMDRFGSGDLSAVPFVFSLANTEVDSSAASDGNSAN